MSHADPAPREGFWERTRRWLTDTYDPLTDEAAAEIRRGVFTTDYKPAPDLADDLPHVLDDLAGAATKATAPTQQALVYAVTEILQAHRMWLRANPDATQAERTATAQRAVFRAVQAGIDVVRPAAATNARRAALEEAAAYVAAQRSVTEAAEGLRRHLDDPTLPVRVERYPHAELLARTTGPLPVVAAAEAVEVIDIN